MQPSSAPPRSPAVRAARLPAAAAPCELRTANGTRCVAACDTCDGSVTGAVYATDNAVRAGITEAGHR
ncbi:hypothetical protein [Streptomyces sp. NPDC048385]|uniref:hypothetical protein n=1 Tax=Streptomyces sp. NPDC048385 TaxID=3155145 RepID=UPI00343C7184